MSATALATRSSLDISSMSYTICVRLSPTKRKCSSAVGFDMARKLTAGRRTRRTDRADGAEVRELGLHHRIHLLGEQRVTVGPRAIDDVRDRLRQPDHDVGSEVRGLSVLG